MTRKSGCVKEIPKVTDIHHYEHELLNKYPHQFFLFLNVIIKQPYIVSDTEGKALLLTLIENIHKKAVEQYKKANASKSKYKSVLNIIVNYSQNNISSDVLKNIDERLSQKDINLISSKNSAYKDLVEAYKRLDDYLDDLGRELDKIASEGEDSEWTKKDVLVGALKNRKQLDVCLKYKFYHVPVESLSLINITVNYIAIYQSKKLFGDFSGVKYWGKVAKCELVNRYEIKEIPSDSDKKYYRFTIEDWNVLYPPIESAGNGTVFCFTNLLMLLNAQSINELYFADKDEFKLYNAIRKGILEELDNVAYRYKDTILTLKDGMLNIFRKDKLIYASRQNEYLKNISGNFLKIKKLY